MSSLSDIVSTQTKLEARFKASKTIPLIDQLIAQIEEQKSALLDARTSSQAVAASSKQVIDRFQKSIAEDQKETYNAQVKHGKAITKRFKVDLTAATRPEIFAGKQHLINNAIALNFIRQGQFEIALAFAEEAQLNIDQKLVQRFESMYSIIRSLEKDDLSEAIRWAAENRQMLEERNSTLEFQLHKTQFGRIFQSSHVFQCIEYAQKNFAMFANRHLKEIQQLMAAVAYHSDLANSPYADLFLSTNKNSDVKNSFITEFTALLEMTPTSPLQTTVEAANLALPTLIKLSTLKIAAPKEGSGVDLPLPKHLRFHSVFVCPVTKEVGGEAWMLGCGHVIGKEAMQSLSKGTPKLKCPYCPVVSELSEGLRLIF
ncbi:protein of unknown function [Taphrina deformans PYCC 5710]|uniref:CTLH domain-containing protein n=1 Tax=Taphrina deformans (strain PYCC 5710 / ATCC 11124 / CBS 356.35 / IMI 108563 / JCM 9778 / NBRC 8474) TaxID=1097556 RepID=R4XL14_TAPDE|nr:protein of unknown function [Taphrina deformans PYCC 5710]|eukprot:CCG85099.1 protein of unknown function [Taphrina deformans PYCC 5710]